MPHTFVNPNTLHDPVPFGYSHTAALPAGAAVVLVSGQYGSLPDGSVVSADFAAQVQQVLVNVREALAAHGLAMEHVVQLRTYVVALDFARLGAIGAAVGSVWGGRPPTQTLIGVAALAMPDILVEIEAVAARPPA